MEATCPPNPEFRHRGGCREYRQIQYFPPLPKVPDIDFRAWTTYQSQAYELELYGNPPNAPAQAWADWISNKTEQYLVQEHPWAAQGRGANLQAVTKPLVPSRMDRPRRKASRPTGKKVRFQLALKQPDTQTKGPVKGFTQATNDTHRAPVQAVAAGRPPKGFQVPFSQFEE